MSRPLLSPLEAARELCISEKQLRALTAAGRIKYVNIGLGSKRETRRYDPADLDDFRLVMTGNWTDPEPEPEPEWNGPSSPIFRRKPAPDASLLGYVYFIASGGKVKIGRAKDVKARMNALQSGCPYPIHLIHYEQGGATAERKLHRKFKAHRDRLEWFRIEGELETFLREVQP
ncbi:MULTISPECIES: GIY-YIG nuclease family protein [unclassified Mesorhizobium]|uniref:GIY-YIG nuclease family protein n=1 Tax=unclassified Mesorhizobium TaxID=325217 RepID=UPI000FCB53FF|nr:MULTISPECIES: GIY-YIG nuclease family protein [unclassified Mesorhizobium]TGT97594.1 hypothetical protein EN806_48735 [bacterium M00.F.Ca.ET.163.01.1.1]TGU44660.1 hypothetical protein EN789_21905 [bacterium M00.F.Ca.ET.146.01.1.1]TGW09996.1 hypothetical protein EN788_22355 [Mesorhizobium sp. M2D.F.Ca.ET.145.01.1.1]TGP34052.1 hypothetical protein EN875_012440 [Mesorhizobium sp. M2D.F.Ca.ET.232.01.1.1]TGQ44083.1 hypothetical protein EN863_014635 [Mesorhizobium sp. M00.F.Ca.ET.220.01.1.1]